MSVRTVSDLSALPDLYLPFGASRRYKHAKNRGEINRVINIPKGYSR